MHMFGTMKQRSPGLTYQESVDGSLLAVILTRQGGLNVPGTMDKHGNLWLIHVQAALPFVKP